MSTAETAARYLRFAAEEADGRCPLYADLARGVAGDAAVLGFLAGLPPARRQPNLLFAALRLVAGLPRDAADLATRLHAHAPAVRAEMLARTTQTNEPARCAVLLTAIADLEEPVALIEVGASAGLCLLADRYGYDWSGHRLGGDAPRFGCAVGPGVKLPARLPHIAWRAGLDLNPLDVMRPEDVAWLECLIWPGQEARLARFRAALAVARAAPPRVVAGDLTRDLPGLLAEVPAGLAVVVFHTAVLAYVPERAAREAFGRQVMGLGARWVSCEAPSVIGGGGTAPAPGLFRLMRDGVTIGWADPHGASVRAA